LKELQGISSGMEGLSSGIQALLVQDKEHKGGFSTASLRRNQRVLTSYGLIMRNTPLKFECTMQPTAKSNFAWDTSKEDSPAQRCHYMKHIRTYLPLDDAYIWLDANGEVSETDGQFKKTGDNVLTVSFHEEGVYDLTGTTDVLLVPEEQKAFPLFNIELIVELKKTTNLEGNAAAAAKSQTIIELVAHGLVSHDKRIVALLTDLNEFYEFYWFERCDSGKKYVKFSQVVKSAAAAHVIITGLLTGNLDPIGQRCSIPVNDLPSILEGKDGGENHEDDANDDNGKSGKKENHDKDKKDNNRQKSIKGKRGNSTAKGQKSINKGQSQFMTYLSLAESLPGANMLSLMDGTNPHADLEVAREYAWSLMATQVGAKKPQTGPLRELHETMQLTADNLALLEASTAL
jgi:hypothetical protein